MTSRARLVVIAAALAVALPAGALAAAGAQPSEDAAAGHAGATQTRALLIGDSVMLGASGGLRRVLGGRAVIDAAVSRQFTEGAAALRRRLRSMPADATVLIHLGNNGYIPFRPFEALMRELSRRPRVVLVTVRVNRRWQDSVNDAIRHAARRYDNAVIADWHAVSGGAGVLRDGAHTTAKGTAIYARTLSAKLPERRRAPAPASSWALRPPRWALRLRDRVPGGRVGHALAPLGLGGGALGLALQLGVAPVALGEDLLFGLAVQQGQELLALDRLAPQQDLGEALELEAVLDQDVAGALVGFLDDAPDLAVDHAGHVVRVVGL